jgi:hypothetical protein
MFNGLRELYQYDWLIFMSATQRWLQGQDPYGVLNTEIGLPGAFAYPPTALSWLSLFVPLGAASFYAWSLLEVGLWVALMRRTGRMSQLVLLVWAPWVAHFVLGQTTLLFIGALWFVFLAEKRGWLCGFILAFTLSKPQTAFLPVIWLLWHTRHDDTRYKLWGGIVIGTILLALPPTLNDPGIWKAWVASMGDYKSRAQFAAPWQGPGFFVVALSAWLWFKQSKAQETNEAPADRVESDPQKRALGNIWPWWLTMTLFPYAGLYPAVTLIPIMRPQRNYWSIGGFFLSSCLIGPVNSFTLPYILSGHVLAAWMINGGPRAARIHAGADGR